MRFSYCYNCGEKLTLKEIGDEGEMPFCSKCNRPVFDMFSTCIITIVVNEYNEIALIKQGYVSDNYVCVAGYIKTGETAEETALREVEEEIGIKPCSVKYLHSYYYEKKDMLMLGFAVTVKKAELKLSDEVDSAKWFSVEKALESLKETSVAKKLLSDYLKEK